MAESQPAIEFVEDAAAAGSPPNWIIDKLIVSGGLYLFAGEAKRGKKSLISLATAACVASGQPFLGRTVQPRPVIYLNMEDGVQRMRWRGKQFGYAQPSWARGMYSFAYGPAGANAVTEMLQRGLRDAFIIIDPLVNFMGLSGGQWDENDASSMTAFLSIWQTVGREQNVTIQFNHHFNKGGEKMRGSTALNASCDGYGESFRTKADDVVKVVWTLRDGKGITYFLKVEADEQERLTIREVDGASVVGKDAVTASQFILELLQQCSKDMWQTRKQVYDWTKERDESLSRRTVMNAINDLIAEGKVEATGRGVRLEEQFRRLQQERRGFTGRNGG